MSNEKTNKGYVYILSNPVMPGILKIGRSNIGGRTRAMEIYSQGGTGVPMPYEMEFEIWSNDCVMHELLIHEYLDKFRINKSREFFQISIPEAIKTVIQYVCIDHELSVTEFDYSTSTNDYIQILQNENQRLTRELLPFKRERIKVLLAKEKNNYPVLVA